MRSTELTGGAAPTSSNVKESFSQNLPGSLFTETLASRQILTRRPTRSWASVHGAMAQLVKASWPTTGALRPLARQTRPIPSIS